MARRDRADSSRDASPLRPADDAVIIDTSTLGVADVVARVLDLVGKV
jgi:cytidylate kinase